MPPRGQGASAVRDCRTLYSTMLSHGWLLPQESQSLVTLEFMQRVQVGQVFCPRSEDVRAAPLCQTPPPQAHLVDKIIQAAGTQEKRGEDTASLERLLGYLVPPSEKQADSAFLVQVLHLVALYDLTSASDCVYKRAQSARPLVHPPNGKSSVAYYKALSINSSRTR